MSIITSVSAAGGGPRNLFTDERLRFAGGGVFLTLALLPLLGFSNYTLHVCVLVFVYVTLSLGLNVVVGLAGLLDLGYVAFYAIGAYTYALLSAHYHLPFPLSLLLGAALAAAAGVVLGWPTIRARGDYLALVTLGFGEIIRLLMRNWDTVTNGPRGLMDVPPPRLAGFVFATPVHYYYLGLCMAAGTFALIWKVKRSAVGQQLTAIRDDEDAATAIGINPVRWKLYAFAVGAFAAGVAGVFFASWQRFVSPESFTLGESILILSIVVLGGMGRLWAIVGAAAFLVLLPEALRGFEHQRVLILGLLLVLAVIIQERLRRRHATPQEGRAPEPHTHEAATDLASEMAPARSLFDAVPPAARPSDDGLLLSLSGVSKNFGGVRALDKVSLRVRRGEIVGLVGVNGAGKTTLFRCIAGAERPDEGEIELYDGHWRIDRLPAYQVAWRGVVRTFQHGGLFRSLTAGENVRLGGRCHEVPSVWEPFSLTGVRGRADSSEPLLRALGAPDPATRYADMSPVEKKLVELARALATCPDVLLIDEPAASMDERARARLTGVLLEVNRRWGTTLIVIEHDLSLLQKLCRRLVVMERGRVIADGPTEDAAVRQAIQRAYFMTEEDHGAA
jgi:branched-chain amino acid transport system permease protein